MEYKKPTGLLHVYGQGAWHEDAFIVGNVEALVALRDALNKLLDADGIGFVNLPDGYIGNAELEFWVNDGEGYPLHVTLLNGDWKTEKWVKLITPYTAEVANDNNRVNIKPWELKATLQSVGR